MPILPRVPRRRFLSLAIGAIGSAALWQSGWLRNAKLPAATVTRRSKALGSEVAITVSAENSQQAEAALNAAFAELETVEAIMSLYRPASQLCVLNRDRTLNAPHAYLLEVLAAATETSQLSNGAFDVTVQPLWELHATCHKAGRTPAPAEIEAACQCVNWRGIEMGREQVRLLDPVRAITLNGIAQGFAADRVAAVLRAHGIEHALINTGEISSIGRKATGESWQVGVQHPREPEAFTAVAELNGRCLSTSGDYATTFSRDFATHHVFNPTTGHSPDELASVTILAPTAMQADALSTAVMVLGSQRAESMLASIADVDALLILKSGRVIKTPGFPEVSLPS